MIDVGQQVNFGPDHLAATPYANLKRVKEDMGVSEPAKFVNVSRAHKKDQEKVLDDISKQHLEDNNNEKSYSDLLVERAQEKDPGMDYLNPV
jgi:hypothetical protein